MENLDICLVAYPTHIIINDMVVIYRKLYIYMGCRTVENAFVVIWQSRRGKSRRGEILR